MTSVAIIGAGQAGTLAAVGLMNAGYSVTLYSDLTADSILNDTAPTGTAFIFGDTVAVERVHGVETFEDVAVPADRGSPVLQSQGGTGARRNRRRARRMTVRAVPMPDGRLTRCP